MTTGEIARKFQIGYPVFEWKISRNLFLLWRGSFRRTLRLTSVYSPEFDILENRWYLKMSKTRDSRDGEGLEFKLQTTTGRLQKSISYKLDMYEDDNIAVKLLREKILISNERVRNKAKSLLLSDVLKRWSHLAASGALVITCTMWAENESPSKGKKRRREDLTGDSATREEDSACLDTKGGAILRKHFRTMLLDGQDHDVTLKVKGKEFKAHRNILQARSPVFAAMFTHDMKEAEFGDVTIDDCDPDAFGQFLEYVYVGIVGNLTPRSALGLYYAGDKYDFPDLKEICVDFLKASLSKHVICDVINLSLKHDEAELLDCAKAFFAEHLLEILMTVEWTRFMMSNPILANELNMKAINSYYVKVE